MRVRKGGKETAENRLSSPWDVVLEMVWGIDIELAQLQKGLIYKNVHARWGEWRDRP